MRYRVHGLRLGTNLQIEQCGECGHCQSHVLHFPDPEVKSFRKPPSAFQRMIDSTAKVEQHEYISGLATVLNGEVEQPEHIDYLRGELGYKLKRCDGIPEWKPSEEELEEMAAADKFLGIHRGESGTTSIERDIKKGMRDFLAPLKKAFHL